MSSSPDGQSPPIDVQLLLDQVMLRDRHRLFRRWQRVRMESHSARQAWLEEVEVSRQLVEDRQKNIPELRYDPELPISQRREEIAELMRRHQTLVVCGETGSGKSTQLPKICLDAGLGRRGMIGHTQPRRLAARAVAARLSEELGTRIGDRVGFKIRFTDKTAPSTLVKLMTDGVLLAETQSDRFLDQYEAIIIDEAHERSLNIDFLMAYLKRLVLKRPELKIVITSATIDPKRFAEHFGDDNGPAPIVEVRGRTYPVEIRYRSNEELADDYDFGVPLSPTDGTPLPALAQAVDELCSAGSGDMLVFLPTERDIRLAAKYLRGWFTNQGRLSKFDILPLYARLSEAEQNRIFQPHSTRRIVLATNVAESSLTVPGIHFVVDTGTARISRYAPRQRVQRLPIEAISQASADQRSGRCGRLGPGICIRLFSQADYAGRTRFTTPEIRRSDLAAVLLQSAMLRLGPLLELPLLDPPSPEAVRDGERTLREIGAFDDRQQLTAIGHQLGKLPCDPRVGRMLLAAQERNVLGDVLVIAAALESQDVRLRPPGQQSAADEAHWEFRDPTSDFVALLRLWHFYENLRGSLSRSRLGKALEQKFLSLQRYREWADIVRQLKEMLASAGYKVGAPHIPLSPIPREGSEPMAGRAAIRQRPHGYDALHQSLLTGLLSGVATSGDNRQYQGAGGSTFSLWPGSGLFARTPKWIMVAEQLETTRRYGRTAAEIDVSWVEKLAAPLLKHSYSDPHWSRKTQAAMVYRRSTLYGLSIVDRKAINLSPIDAIMARSLMISHALVHGESNCREKFLLHNQAVLNNLQSLAERSRRRDLLVDPYALEQFYQERLPESVVDLASLRQWLSRNSAMPETQALLLKPEDVLGKSLETPPENHFPERLQIGSNKLPLAYRFHPGDASDGVTVTIPQIALRQVSDEALGWLVPGLLQDKLLHIIRSLPKHLRRNFVPAPDVSRKLACELLAGPRDIPFSTAVCNLLTRHAGERIAIEDIDWHKLPDHLRFRISVVDDAGKEVEVSRDLTHLQSKLAADSPEIKVVEGGPGPAGSIASQWNGRRITSLDFERLPDSISVVRGGVKVAAFPALIDDGDAVALRLVDNRADASQLSRFGWLRLYAIKYRREITNQVSHLPNWDRTKVLLSQLLPSAALRDQLRDLIARIAFIEDQSPLVDAADYEARALDSTRRISIATQDVAVWLPVLAEHYHAARLCIESAPGPWREVADDITSQVRRLTTDHFLSRTPWRYLKEYPRYFQAARMRWDKLRSGGVPKDRKLREPIDALTARFDKTKTLPNVMQIPDRIEDIRFLLEELRVSIFAQNLGTRQSVSVKRIEEMIENVSSHR